MKTAHKNMLPNVFLIILVIGKSWFAAAGRDINSMGSNKLDRRLDGVKYPGFDLNTVDSKISKRFARVGLRINAEKSKRDVRRPEITKQSENNGLIDASNFIHLDPSSIRRRKEMRADCFAGPTRRCFIRVKNVTNIEYIYGDDFGDKTARYQSEDSQPDRNSHGSSDGWNSENLVKKFRFEGCFPDSYHIDPLDRTSWDTICWKYLKKDRESRIYAGAVERIERSWYKLAVKASLVSPDTEVTQIKWLANRYLKIAVSHLSSENKRLYIIGGTIKLLGKGYLQNDYIRELDLHGNNISKIEDGAIVMPQLVNLTLSGNRLNKIKLLPPLPSSLQTLSLAANDIRKVPSGSFPNLKHLKDLILSENKITDIAIDAFKYLVELEWLDLTGNRISDLDPGVFKGLVNLRYLVLRDNKLSIIHPEVFDLPQLTALDISRNKITYIIKGTFGKAGNLCFLEISENRVTELGNGVLFGVKKHYPCNAVVWRLPLKTIAGGVFDDV